MWRRKLQTIGIEEYQLRGLSFFNKTTKKSEIIKVPLPNDNQLTKHMMQKYEKIATEKKINKT